MAAKDAKVVVFLRPLRRSQRHTAARVVKLVDTGDLKSPGRLGCAGSSPASGTIRFIASSAFKSKDHSLVSDEVLSDRPPNGILFYQFPIAPKSI